MATGAWCFNKSMRNKRVVNQKKHPSQHSRRSAKKLVQGTWTEFRRGDRTRSKFNVLRGSGHSTIFQWSFDVWSMSILLENPQVVTNLTHGGLVFRTRGSQPSLWGYDPWSLKKKTYPSQSLIGCFLNTPQPRKKMEKNWEDWGENVIHGTMHNPWVLIFSNYLIVPPSMQSLSTSVICTVGMIMFD